MNYYIAYLTVFNSPSESEEIRLGYVTNAQDALAYNEKYLDIVIPKNTQRYIKHTEGTEPQDISIITLPF